jgi:hypothetical protein
MKDPSYLIRLTETPMATNVAAAAAAVFRANDTTSADGRSSVGAWSTATPIAEAVPESEENRTPDAMKSRV